MKYKNILIICAALFSTQGTHAGMVQGDSMLLTAIAGLVVNGVYTGASLAYDACKKAFYPTKKHISEPAQNTVRKLMANGTLTNLPATYAWFVMSKK